MQEDKSETLTSYTHELDKNLLWCKQKFLFHKLELTRLQHVFLSMFENFCFSKSRLNVKLTQIYSTLTRSNSSESSRRELIVVVAICNRKWGRIAQAAARKSIVAQAKASSIDQASLLLSSEPTEYHQHEITMLPAHIKSIIFLHTDGKCTCHFIVAHDYD